MSSYSSLWCGYDNRGCMYLMWCSRFLIGVCWRLLWHWESQFAVESSNTRIRFNMWDGATDWNWPDAYRAYAQPLSYSQDQFLLNPPANLNILYTSPDFDHVDVIPKLMLAPTFLPQLFLPPYCFVKLYLSECKYLQLQQQKTKVILFQEWTLTC